MDKYTTKNKIILISQSIENNIAYNNESEYKFIISNDILSNIEKLIHENKHPHNFFVIICTTDEYLKMKNHLSNYHYHDMIYHVILKLDKLEKIPKNLIKDKHIGHIWSEKLSKIEFVFSIETLFHRMQNEYRIHCKNSEFRARLLDMKQDQEDLINIGRSLTSIKDTNKLLREILYLSKKITEADAGSIYLIEEIGSKKQIRFKFSHTYSKEVPLEEFTLPYDISSIAGFVAVTGKVLNIPDVYKLEKDGPISFNNSFDKLNHYRSKSMLVVPMRNHLDEIIGVIQLINSKISYGEIDKNNNIAFSVKLDTPEDFEYKVHPFEHRYEDLMEAVAGQAAIAIENNRMIDQIQHQFEEFVRASVIAIESRDPATSGHSLRVAEICKVMANSISESEESAFKDIYFNETQKKELEYAALLHDFGKVYIDLAIFMKARKLFPKEMENLLLKIDYLYKTAELNYLNDEKIIALANQNKLKSLSSDTNINLTEIEVQKKQILDNIKSIKDKLSELNQPSILSKDSKKILDSIINDIRNIDCQDINGHEIEIINTHEKENLSIKKGSLNEEERKEIESHVVHTYNFVSKIPWPHEYRNIPKIARWHHEKLDGSGYPDGIKADEIPLQAKMMAIADVYDALTATDRPYKKAIPHERAIDILQKEAENNKLDKDLVDVLIKSNIDKILADFKSTTHDF